MIRPFG